MPKPLQALNGRDVGMLSGVAIANQPKTFAEVDDKFMALKYLVKESLQALDDKLDRIKD